MESSHLKLKLPLRSCNFSGGKLKLRASDLDWFILKLYINPKVVKDFLRLGIEIWGCVTKNNRSSAYAAILYSLLWRCILWDC